MRVLLISTFLQCTGIITATSILTTSTQGETNRRLEASIAAQTWPTTATSPICETLAYLDSAPTVNDDVIDQQEMDQSLWRQFASSFHQQWKQRYLNVLVENLLYTSTHTAAVDEKEEGQSFFDVYQDRTKRALDIASQSYQHDTESQPSLDFDTTLESKLLQYALSTRAHSPYCETQRILSLDAMQAFPCQEDIVSYASFGIAVIPQSTNDMEKYEIFRVSTPEDLISIIERGASTTSVDTCKLTSSIIPHWARLLPDEVPIVHMNSDDLQNNSFPIILYGRLDTKEFGSLYQALIKQNVPFVVRSSDNPDKSTGMGKTVLQGYGVRLDIRNVEYKVYDDKAESSDDVDEDTDLQDSESNNGIGNNDDLDDQLIVPLKRLDDIPHDDERSDLSLQATFLISIASDPLATMEKLSQDLPSYAYSLSRDVKLPSSVKKLAQRMNMIASAKSIIRQSGSHAENYFTKSGVFEFYINGRRILVERSFNLFELISILREEKEILNSIQTELGAYLPLDKKSRNKSLSVVSSLLFMGLNDFKTAAKKSDKDEESFNPMGQLAEDDDQSPTKIRIDVGRGYRKAVLYLNDLEKDDMYRSWPRSLFQMITSAQMGGGAPSVRRNVLTYLLVVDPFKRFSDSDLDAISDKDSDSMQEYLRSIHTLMTFMERGFPLRIGILFASEDDIDTCQDTLHNDTTTGIEVCDVTPPILSSEKSKDIMENNATTHATFKLLNYVTKEINGMASVSYMYGLILGCQERLISGNQRFTLRRLFELHTTIMQQLHLPSSEKDFLKIIQDDAEEEISYMEAVKFAIKKKIHPNDAFLNGLSIPVTTDSEAVQTAMMSELQYIMNLVITSKLSDRTRSIYAYLLTGDNVYSSMHPILVEEKPKYHVIPHHFLKNKAMNVVNRGSSDLQTALFDLVVDHTNTKGLTLVSSFLSSLKSWIKNEEVIDTFIAYHILPRNKKSCKSVLGSIFRHSSDFTTDELLDIVHAVIAIMQSDQRIDDIEKLSSKLNDSLFEIVTQIVKEDQSSDYEEQCMIMEASQDLTKQADYLLTNGRLFHPKNTVVSPDDIKILFETEKGAGKFISKQLSALIPNENIQVTTGRVAAFLGNQFSAKKLGVRYDTVTSYQNLMAELSDKESERKIFYHSWNEDSNDSDLKIKVTVVLDPLSEATQRAAPILKLVRDHLKLPLTMVLMPREKIDNDSSLPITSYYRFLHGSPLEQSKSWPKASFSNLPTKHILTTRMDIPEPWDVQKVYAIQDTDNLRCDKNSCGDISFYEALRKNSDNYDGSSLIESAEDSTVIEYGLNHLLLFGQCYDLSAGTPPNGLQFSLSEPVSGSNTDFETVVYVLPDGSLYDESKTDEKAAYSTDTLVMKTAGYWQLRANPGVWELKIAEESKGSSIFDIVKDMSDPSSSRLSMKEVSVEASKTLVMKDFMSRSEVILVKRRLGFESAELLAPDNDDTDDDDDTVHVFSLATGHLYERFLKIMMLSVTKRTSTKVKFWLFENFLSPSFKASALAMAERIGCEVEFVTYKWPEGWLRGQSEQQRIIWGYKILFLDVLFPLNLKKIIYVDADQVVRGDLKELWDMDLNGAPYGYTPMCSSREDTENFQFWNQGFWKDMLAGKPYHISALYVVDLQRFRRELVGDKLRGIYQNLSADPNNLSNLDQDLPNYAAGTGVVKIHSLPQDWLWCESWCSDETKATAKTIDLCNNPKFKEPKVSMAKRIISGDLFEESWIELDAEVDGYDKEYFKTVQGS